jgi:uncharacterized membrane protein YbhN (UPF0104 family)
MANRVAKWVRACVGIGLLALLLSQLEWSELAVQLDNVSWPLVGVAALLYPTALLINAAKWSAALRLHDLSFRFGRLLRISCIGFFVNNLLPSAIGGDIYRVYRTSGNAATSQAVSALLVERGVGLVAMLINGLIGAILLAQTSELARIYVAWCLGAFAAAAVVVVLYGLGQHRLNSALEASPRLRPISMNIKRIARVHPAWLALIGYSFGFQLLAAATILIAFAAVGAQLSVSGALLATVAAGLAAIVPISISGLGVVEGSIVAAGVALGVQYDAALLGALVLRGLSLICGLGCGIVYALDKSEPPIAIPQPH